MAVVKANAYGHGLLPVAQLLAENGVDALGVALLEEALALRQHGVNTPILVFGGLLERQIPAFLTHQIDITVSSLVKLQQVEACAVESGIRARVHLKIDTGMGRIGTRHNTCAPLIEAAVASKQCDLVGIFSHFACADDPNDPLTQQQLERFQDALRTFERLQAPVPLRHLANSGAILHFPESTFDMVRPGIILYGVQPDPLSARALALQPALRLKARTVFQKGLPKGHSVSYGASWTAPKNTWISTVPVGYGDGYFRAFSNRGAVLSGGKRYAVVGRVCMDQFMIETPEQALPNDAEVTLVGREGTAQITIEELAEQVGTIPYEILTNLNTRLPRKYVE